MKCRFLIYPLIALVFVLIIANGCRKNYSDSDNIVRIAKDIDSNVYHVVRIGKQLWFAENLKTKRYSDGTAIPYVTDNTGWIKQTSGAYCWHNNDTINKNIYGALYNHYTVMSHHDLCPSGWHVPTQVEWSIMLDYLGNDSIAVGGFLKESGIKHWISPNTKADNSTGFTALPGGARDMSDGDFSYAGGEGVWWASIPMGSYPFSPITFELDYDSPEITCSGRSNTSGFSVRCIVDYTLL